MNVSVRGIINGTLVAVYECGIDRAVMLYPLLMQ